MYSKSAGYNINKQAEQKIIYLENMIRDNDGRLKESEQHAISKEKELNEALTRLREYESGDYQLQQAVNEIKGLKNQIKIRDRDIETLTKHLNKLDFTLNDVLEENDDFRAKLGMQPKEKLNLDELNNLRAIKAQENRAYVYVLQREVTNLVKRFLRF
jgi:centrosomal protein CEP290